MGHHHNHTHDHSSQKNILMAFILNFCFTCLEIAGGLYVNSISILSDALHDLGDSLSLGLAWILEKKSRKKSTKNFTYGYKRLSLLAAVINSLIMITGSAIIIYRAIPRIIHPEEVHTPGMMIMAVIGIFVNGLAVLRLRKGKGINEKVVFLHLLEDVLGWIVVLVAGIVMHFTRITILDPILSLLITIFITARVSVNLYKTVRIFLQSVPDSITTEHVIELLSSIELVKTAHDLHVWSLDGTYNVLTVHIVVDNTSALTPDQYIEIKRQCKEVLSKEGIHHSTIEIEYSNEECDQESCL